LEKFLGGSLNFVKFLNLLYLMFCVDKRKMGNGGARWGRRGIRFCCRNYRGERWSGWLGGGV
jgi:hypothetical protein